MKQLIFLLPSCTDREALNLAVFFHETFVVVERWRVSPSHVQLLPLRPARGVQTVPVSHAGLGCLQQPLTICTIYVHKILKEGLLTPVFWYREVKRCTAKSARLIHAGLNPSMTSPHRQ